MLCPWISGGIPSFPDPPLPFRLSLVRQPYDHISRERWLCLLSRVPWDRLFALFIIYEISLRSKKY